MAPGETRRRFAEDRRGSRRHTFLAEAKEAEKDEQFQFTEAVAWRQANYSIRQIDDRA
jgi:hypothetical protein